MIHELSNPIFNEQEIISLNPFFLCKYDFKA